MLLSVSWWENLARLEQNGFRIVAIKMVQLNQEQAEGFFI